MSATPAATTAPATLSSLGALYRLLARTQVTVPRLLGIAGLGSLAVLMGLFARYDDNPTQAAADVISAYGLALLVPFSALWLGTAAVGDLIEDRLLVYLWLKPVADWQLPAAAILATATIVVPLTALPLALAALVAGAGGVAWAALLATTLGGLAYSGLFVAVGLWFRRGLWVGLVFVLLWENAIAYSADGAARFTVVGWASSILGGVSEVDVPLDAGATAMAVVVLPAVAIAAWLVATWRYGRADVD
jgi:ABC-2 type transport system permease protein